MATRTKYAQTAICGACTVAVLLAATASAQSNSLFGGGRAKSAAAPARANGNAPNAGRAAPQTGGGAGSARAARPLMNPVLLDTSLIAVRLPDMRMIQVNDLLTVIVREDRKSISDAKLESEKTWDIQSELKDWLRINSEDKLVPQNFPEGTPKIGFQYDNQYDGKGKHERKDTLVTRLAVKVIDVKPNGNLIIQGRKELRIGEEVHVATLTGECNADDVTPERSILSTQVYDLKIDMPDAGAVRDATRRGWLMKLIDFARPF
jgi:flagellar L-ring protein precursor FlgH